MRTSATAGFPRGISIARIVISLALAAAVFALLPDAFESTALQWPVLILGSALAWAICAAFAARSEEWTLVQTTADGPVLLLVITVFASALVSWSPGASGSAALAATACALCYFGATNFVTSLDDVDRLLRSIVVITALVTVIGLFQYATPELLPIDFHLTAGMRPVGTFGNSIVLSSFLAIVIPPLVALRMRSGKGERRWLTALLLATVTLFVLTRTRSSMIALGVAMIVLATARRELRTSALVVLAAVVLAGAAALTFLEPVSARQPGALFDASGRSSIARRFDLWSAAFRAIDGSPVLGHGVGRTADILPPYRNPDYWISGSEDIVPHVHNEPLQIVVDLGLIGLVIAGLLTFTVWRGAFRAVTRTTPDVGLAAAGILSGIAAGIVDSLASPALHQAPLAGLIAFFSGVLLSPALSSHARIQSVRPGRWRMIGWIAVAGFIGLAVIVALSMHSIIRGERLMNAATVAEISGEHSTALLSYTEASRVEPTNRLALFNAARLSLRLGQAERTLQFSDALHRLSPDFPRSHLLEAQALLVQGEPDRALEAVRREARLRSHPEVYLLLARISAVRGDSDLERDALLQSLRASTRGKIAYRFSAICSRLLMLSSGPAMLRELRDALSGAALALPNDPTLAQALQTVDSLLVPR